MRRRLSSVTHAVATRFGKVVASARALQGWAKVKACFWHLFRAGGWRRAAAARRPTSETPRPHHLELQRHSQRLWRGGGRFPPATAGILRGGRARGNQLPLETTRAAAPSHTRASMEAPVPGPSGATQPSPAPPEPGTPALRVVGWRNEAASPGARQAAARRTSPPPESPLAALLRTSSSRAFNTLPALKLGRRACAPGGASPRAGAATPSPSPSALSRSSDPIGIPKMRCVAGGGWRQKSGGGTAAPHPSDSRRERLRAARPACAPIFAAGGGRKCLARPGWRRRGRAGAWRERAAAKGQESGPSSRRLRAPPFFLLSRRSGHLGDATMLDELSSVESATALFPPTPVGQRGLSPRAQAARVAPSTFLTDLTARAAASGQDGAAKLLAELAAAEADRVELQAGAAALAAAAGRDFLFDDLDLGPSAAAADRLAAA